MKERIYEEKYRRTIICVDSYKDCVPEGRIFNPFITDGDSFYGVIDMLCRVEGIMNKMKFPQPTKEFRCYQTEMDRNILPAANCYQRGSLGTFIVRVLFRQHASWQGIVTSCDSGEEGCFNSVLELLMFMNSVLSKQLLSKEKKASGKAKKDLQDNDSQSDSDCKAE